MREIFLQIFREVTSAWRFRWVGAATAWVVCLAGWLWVAWQPNVYQASARVYVDASSVLRPILENRIVANDVATQLGFVRQALLGREHLERVVHDNNLDVAAVTDREREEVINSLRTAINITTTQAQSDSSSTYNISYQHTSRETAASVVRALLSSLVEDTLGANRQGTDTAERFLEERIREYETRLRNAEQARANFQRENAGRLSGESGNYFERIQSERKELDAVQRQLRLAEARRDRLIEQMRGDLPVMPLAFGSPSEASGELGDLNARIAEYRQRLDQLLLDFTDKHPDVIGVRNVISQLEAQREQQMQAASANPQSLVSALATNPIYQEVQIRLNEVEVEIASFEADIRQRAATLAELQGRMDELPQVEAELARLNRDYTIVYDQYQALVQSRETQDLSRKAQDTDQIDFRVINPPLAGFEPIAPQRLVLLSAVLAAGLGLGGALCWVLAQLKPVFSETATLREITGLPVLGGVSSVVAPGAFLGRQAELFRFMAALAVLVVVYTGVVGFEVFGPGVHSLIGSGG